MDTSAPPSPAVRTGLRHLAPAPALLVACYWSHVLLVVRTLTADIPISSSSPPLIHQSHRVSEARPLHAPRDVAGDIRGAPVGAAVAPGDAQRDVGHLRVRARAAAPALRGADVAAVG